ncbi:MAG: zinc ribbon domain-containing protein [Conexivisphaera sp.]
MTVCPVCGASNPEGAAFCIVCGSSIKKSFVPADVLKKYEIYVDKGAIEFRGEDKVPEMTIRKSGSLGGDHRISEGESVMGRIDGDKVYDGSGKTLLAVIKSPNVKPTQNKLRNYVNSTLSPATGVTVVRTYWIEDATGNVLAKTVHEEAKQRLLNSINYLNYDIVDEGGTIARVEPRESAINVGFLHLRYHLYLYSQRLQPVMLASLVYAIKRGDDEYESLYVGFGGGAY